MGVDEGNLLPVLLMGVEWYMLTRQVCISPLTKWKTIKKPLVHKIRLHGRRVKGTAESFSREKLRQALQKEVG